MNGTLIALLLLGAPPAEGVENAAATLPQATLAEQTPAAPRSGVELRDAVRAALARWARPQDKDAEKAAVAFLRLYDELYRDDQLAASQREYLRTKVRSRLLGLSKQISKRIAREKRLAKDEPKNQGADEDRLPASVDLPEGKGEPLAQNVAVANFATGFGQSGFGRGGSDDYGPQLVELIQRTIAPSTWDINGGPGSIYYWRPGRALVIRQMDAVHDDVGNLLRQLDQANR